MSERESQRAYDFLTENGFDEVDGVLFRGARDGQEMADFLNTTPGRILADRARMCMSKYVRACMMFPPTGVSEEIRSDAEAAQTAMDWIAQTIIEGREAETLLRSRDNDD